MGVLLMRALERSFDRYPTLERPGSPGPRGSPLVPSASGRKYSVALEERPRNPIPSRALTVPGAAWQVQLSRMLHEYETKAPLFVDKPAKWTAHPRHTIYSTNEGVPGVRGVRAGTPVYPSPAKVEGLV